MCLRDCVFICVLKCYVCVGETGWVGEKEGWHMGMICNHLSIMWVGEAGWPGPYAPTHQSGIAKVNKDLQSMYLRLARADKVRRKRSGLTDSFSTPTRNVYSCLQNK